MTKLIRKRRAEEALEELRGRLPQVETFVSPDEIISRISATILDVNHLDDLVKLLATNEHGVWEHEDFSKLVGVSPLSNLIFNSAFIRSAARHQVVFYIGSDRRIYRQRIKSDEEVDHPVKISGVKAEKDYFVKPPWYDDLAAFIQEGSPTLLIGPPGVGKSEACERIFEEMGQQLHVVPCNQSMTSDDLEGRIELRTQGDNTITKFEPGVLAVASQAGHGVLLDDADAIPSAASFGIFRLLAGKEMQIIRLGADGLIPRHDAFCIVGTQNTEGRGDDRGLHHGRSYQDEAFLDRWDNVIRVDYPSREVETLILRNKTGLLEDAIERIIDSAELLRRALKEDTIMFCCSMRRTLAVAENIVRGFSPKKSWFYAVVNRATKEDAENIVVILERVYGSTWDR